MMQEGWLSKIAMWRDDDPDHRFRPPGVSSVSLSPQVLTSWQHRDVFGHVTDAVPVVQAWGVSFHRQMTVDFLTGEWIRAVAANAQAAGSSLTGSIDRDEAEAPITWSMEVIFPDGTARRINRLALQKWEVVTQSGRTGLEEIELVALSAEDFDSEDFVEPETRLFIPTAGPLISHSFAAGVYTGTDMTNPGAKVATFSSQLIFDRKVSAVQFGLDGKATRHALGPWDITGKSVLRMAAALYGAALDTAMQAALWWNVGTVGGTDFLRVCLPSVRAKVADQEVLAGQIVHQVEYIGTAYRRGFLARFAANFTPLFTPGGLFYYFRPDGVSRYLRPDGISYYLRAMADLTLTEEQDALFTAATPEEFVAALVGLGLPGNLAKAAPDGPQTFIEFKKLEDDTLIGKSLLEA